MPVESSPVHGVTLKERLIEWCKAVAQLTSHDFNEAMDALQIMFFGSLYNKSSIKTLPGEELVTCKHCNCIYRQSKNRQTPCLRFYEDDICPYCNNSNGSSLEFDFNNRK